MSLTLSLPSLSAVVVVVRKMVVSIVFVAIVREVAIVVVEAIDRCYCCFIQSLRAFRWPDPFGGGILHIGWPTTFALVN